MSLGTVHSALNSSGDFECSKALAWRKQRMTRGVRFSTYLGALAATSMAWACGGAIADSTMQSTLDAGGVIAGSCQAAPAGACADLTASSCGTLGCCPSSTPFACPANGLCYETQDTALAGCGTNVCYACNAPAGGDGGPGSQCLPASIGHAHTGVWAPQA
jgi:hypothetical protein